MTTLGEIGYNAYGEAREWVTAAGGDMPRWNAQRPELAAAWEVAGHAIAAAIIRAAEAASPELDRFTVVGRAKIEAELTEMRRLHANQAHTIDYQRDEIKDLTEKLAATRAALTRLRNEHTPEPHEHTPPVAMPLEPRPPAAWQMHVETRGDVTRRHLTTCPGTKPDDHVFYPCTCPGPSK